MGEVQPEDEVVPTITCLGTPRIPKIALRALSPSPDV